MLCGMVLVATCFPSAVATPVPPGHRYSLRGLSSKCRLQDPAYCTDVRPVRAARQYR